MSSNRCFTFNSVMRPSTRQLLKNERLEFGLRVSETEKLRNIIQSRELDLNRRELQMKDEIQRKSMTLNPSSMGPSLGLSHSCYEAIQEAIRNREDELHALVLQREHEVAKWIQMEDEIMNAPCLREVELLKKLHQHEEAMHETLRRQLEDRERVLKLRDDDIQRREIAVTEKTSSGKIESQAR
ncbi:hypothetical protein B0H14DRAFT_2575887 [Mycena olivaceomarginata]|nr:hypothetical protein B0H14DRAFT_2575887 [Mycena olivaceomarginata]